MERLTVGKLEQLYADYLRNNPDEESWGFRDWLNERVADGWLVIYNDTEV